MMTRKREGSGFGELASSLIAIMAIVMVALFFIGAVESINRRVNIDMTVRGYVLSLESSGCLTTKQIDRLRKELVAAGMKEDTISICGYKSNGAGKFNWDADGSTTAKAIGLQTPVGYGNRVGIKITGKVPDNPFILNGFWLESDSSKLTDMTIVKISTAKY